ncbi:hypothetical protein E2C01_093292 [Portunus trituberculatus]|uniref:Uncharacterized protein n=1 Tax=Portunus trituberculatus TaxID=210409 RepID=A0A5B7JUE5_PORTR|nr:hypothetical protein [Portunus trituberculatus]
MSLYHSRFQDTKPHHDLPTENKSVPLPTAPFGALEAVTQPARLQQTPKKRSDDIQLLQAPPPPPAHVGLSLAAVLITGETRRKLV